MTSAVDRKFNFRAIDNVTGVVDRISARFPKLTKAASASQRKFDSLQASSKKLRGNLTRLGGGMKSVGLGMTAGLTLPIAAFGTAAFRTTTDFQKGMNKVQALTGGTKEELMGLEKEALRLGGTTAFTARQAADAMAFFGQAGFNTNQILKSTAPTLALAAAASTDLGRTADIMSNIMGGFNITAEESARAADVLALTTAKGNVNLEMLGESMKDAAPVAQKYGASLEEVSALTAKLGDAGIQGSKAGTTLKNMFLRLAAPTKRIKGIMGSLGVETVDPSTGKMRKMTDVLVDMDKAFKAKGISSSKKLAVLNEVFGLRAVAGAGVLLESVTKIDPATGKLVNTVAELEEKLMNAAGTSTRMQNTIEKGLPGAVNSVTSAWQNLQIMVMKSGFDLVLADVLNMVADLLRWIADLNPTVLKWGSILAAVVAIMGPMLFIMGGIVSALPFLITGFEALAVIFPILQIGLAPVLLIMAKFLLIAGLIAAVAILIYENWSSIAEFFSNAWDKPLETLKEMVSFATSLVGLGDSFGFGTSAIDQKLKDQGFTINDGEKSLGQETGSKELTKKNFEYMQRKQQASVDVKFSNMPAGTRVITEDKDSMLNVGTGLMAN